MKKLLASLAAVLTFSMASAQIDTDRPQQTQPDAVKKIEPDGKNKADQDVDVPIHPKTMENRKDKDPLKDELKTKNHVKSTPDPSIVDESKDNKSKAVRKQKKNKKIN